MRNKNVSKQRELFDQIVQILKEQFANVKPNVSKVNKYINESYS